MAKKPVETKHEFIKFIKKLFTVDFGLSSKLSETFSMFALDDKIFITFPKKQFYFMNGLINLDLAPKFKEWLEQNKGKKVTFITSNVDDLRKTKLGDFESVEYNESFKIKTVEKEYDFKLEELETDDYCQLNNVEYETVIKPEYLEKSILQVYLLNNNLIFDRPDTPAKMILDTSVRNIKIVLKKEENSYYLKIGEMDENNTRLVQITATGVYCTLNQFFRVI